MADDTNWGAPGGQASFTTNGTVVDLYDCDSSAADERWTLP